MGIRSIGRKLPAFLEDAENGLSTVSRALFARLFEHFRALDRQIEELEREINAWHREDTASQRLQAIPGIGPLTASALIHGARSVLLSAKRHPDRANEWLVRVASRRNPNIAAVALANKNARVVWAMLAHGRDYQVGYRSANGIVAA